MEKETKALRYARMTVLLTGCILALLCTAALLLVPKAVQTLEHA